MRPGRLSHRAIAQAGRDLAPADEALAVTAGRHRGDPHRAATTSADSGVSTRFQAFATTCSLGGTPSCLRVGGGVRLSADASR
ncbi:hypothetical protein [Amycolatopsis magusensis]|uniref:hypothetical protein n=1 Tax=Amycolatopsis magusensis TaxID=882444 RepID=UPI003C30001B